MKDSVNNEEIDLLELLRTLRNEWKTIVKAMSLFMVLGIVLAITSKNEYSSSCKLLPESGGEGISSKLGGLGNLAGLAGMAGISLDMSGEGALSVDLFPQIVNSLPFQLEVLHDSIYFENKGIRTSPYHYFNELDRMGPIDFVLKYTVGLPGLIKKQFDDSELEQGPDLKYLRLTKDDWKMIESFRERITIDIDDETGIVIISTIMPDPFATAEMTDKIVNLLTAKLTSYRLEKANKRLHFVQSSYDSAKQNFLSAQKLLANALDRNKNVTSEKALIEIRLLENNYDLAFDIYKGLATTLEQAKIEINENTPIFTILEPARIPEDKSKPKRIVMILTSAFLGFLLGNVLVMTRHFLSKNKTLS